VRAVALSVALAIGALAARPHGQAASDASTVTASAIIAGLAKLSLSSLTLTFPDANPDIVTVIPASGGPLSISAKARATPGSTVTLTVEALDDLRSGTDVIPASALTWTGVGAGFANGIVARGTARTVASWPGSGARNGTQAYTLQNSWTYATGTYTLTLTYTLTAP